ncbi:MAG: dTDP-4-dehydrorhamnose 3,5-epimerase family protein [Solirubrobacteraceae bacterium]
MRFTETPLKGAWLLELERHTDERGSFARTFCRDEWLSHGLDPTVAQCSTSLNPRVGTLRGMHYQAEPIAETKLVRCTRGSIYDAIVDIRPRSPTYLSWHTVELSARNGLQLYVPRGMAHGFQTLEDDTEVLYQMGAAFVAEAQRGIRFDDPAIAVDWPEPPLERIISERDAGYPDFQS